jgi:hypothetical protein
MSGEINANLETGKAKRGTRSQKVEGIGKTAPFGRWEEGEKD